VLSAEERVGDQQGIEQSGRRVEGGLDIADAERWLPKMKIPRMPVRCLSRSTVPLRVTQTNHIVHASPKSKARVRFEEGTVEACR